MKLPRADNVVRSRPLRRPPARSPVLAHRRPRCRPFVSPPRGGACCRCARVRAPASRRRQASAGAVPARDYRPGEVVVRYSAGAGAARARRSSAAAASAAEGLRAADARADDPRRAVGAATRRGAARAGRGVATRDAELRSPTPSCGAERPRARRHARRLAGAAVELPRRDRASTRRTPGSNLIAAGRPGGARRDRRGARHGRRLREPRALPPLAGPRRQALRRSGYDFVDDDPYPNDENGHGTHVAGTIAEAHEQRRRPHRPRLRRADHAGARARPARRGRQRRRSPRGIRYAADHGAQVINLSFEFGTVGHGAREIPDILAALRYAHSRGRRSSSAPSGNAAARGVAYPARSSDVLVGRRDDRARLPGRLLQQRRRAWTSSRPAAAPDADLAGDPNCRPDEPRGRDIYQMTFDRARCRRFGLPGGYMRHLDGRAARVRRPPRSSSPPACSAPHPSPARDRGAAEGRPRATSARPGRDALYGAGLVDAAAATAPTVTRLSAAARPTSVLQVRSSG